MEYKDKSYEELVKEENRLRKKYEEIEDDCAKKGLPYEEFCNQSRDVKEKLYYIGKYKRTKQDPVVEYGKEWKGDLMEIEKFIALCKNDSIDDNDGYGFYATETSKSDVIIVPSDVKENIIREDFSHVIWFEK
jgi:hypothetical protein